MKKIAYIKNLEVNSGRELLKFLKKKKIFVSPWIENILHKKKFNIKKFFTCSIIFDKFKKGPWC